MIDVRKYQTVLDEETFLAVVDLIHRDCSQRDRGEDRLSDEDVLVEFLGTIAELSYMQGLVMMRSAKPCGVDVNMEDQIYESFQATSNRYEMARHYLYSTYQIELHPLFIMIFIRGLFDSRSALPYDTTMAKAFSRFIEVRENEIKQAFETNEVVSPDDIDPNANIDPDTFKNFFELFKELKEFHRNRNDYESDEARSMHDELMKLYYTIRDHKEEQS